MRKFVARLRRSKKGAALVEYGLLVSGVALISAAAVAVFGHKVNDLIGAMTVVLPGAHAADNGPVVSGQIIETNPNHVHLDGDAIEDNLGTARLGNGLGAHGDFFDGLILEAGGGGH